MKHYLTKLATSILFCFLIFSSITYNYCVSTPTLNSASAILVDSDSSAVLYTKNADSKIYPASITKLLTAYLAINALDLDKAIVVTKTGIAIPWDSSRAYLSEGEIISARDLLYCALLSSGNDAASMLAESVSGSIDSFVVLMNKTALELGCTNTNFANPHGYHDDEHYTTAADMMKIVEFVLKNDTLKKICETKEYTVAKTNKSLGVRRLVNTNRLLLTSSESPSSRYYSYALGGKTGSTEEAGNCLVSWAKKGDENLILGVFNSKTTKTEDERYTDAISLFEYGFNNFDKSMIFRSNAFDFSIVDKEENIQYDLKLNKVIYSLKPIGTNLKEVAYILEYNNFDSLKDIKDLVASQESSIKKNATKNDNISTSIINLPFTYNTSDGGKYSINLPFNITTIKLDSKTFFQHFISTIFYIDITILGLIILMVLKTNKKRYESHKRKIPRNVKTTTRSTSQNKSYERSTPAPYSRKSRR